MSQQLIEESIEFCREYLFRQGPLEYFIALNKLRAFEKFNFYDGLRYASSLYNARTHKSIYWYQKRFRSGRINLEDLEWSINRFIPNKKITLQGKSIDKHKLMVDLLFLEPTSEKVKFHLYERKLISHLKLKENSIPDKFKRVQSIYQFLAQKRRHVDLWNETEIFLSRFFAAYFDKGVAYWQLETKDEGILKSFVSLAKDPFASGWKAKLYQILKDYEENPKLPQELICDIVQEMGIDEDIVTNYIFQSLFHLKGWMAMAMVMEAKVLETNKYHNTTGIKVSLEEMACVVLMTDLAIFREHIEELKNGFFEFKLIENEECLTDNIYSHLFHYLEKSGINLRQLSNSGDEGKLEPFVSLINEFTLYQIWQEAFEINVISKACSNLKEQSEKLPEKEKDSKIKYHVVVCIDDREESIRRILEELSSEVATYGTAGHFGLTIAFKGYDRLHFRPLCPLPVHPTLYVMEEFDSPGLIRRLTAKFKVWFFHHSKTGISSVLLSLLAGVISVFAMVLDVFSPSLKFKILKYFSGIFMGKEKTKLNFLQEEREGDLKGFTLPDMVSSVKALLETIGLTNNFGKFVYVVGHGSTSVNNPHEYVYDCGACGGGKGMTNARIIANIANREDVREKLVEEGIKIPDETVFIAGYHNTANDDLLTLDVSEDLKKDLEFIKFRRLLDEAKKFDAKERLRKFYDVGLNVTPSEAFQKAQARVFTFSQPRPEYGHSTNALCIIGPRSKSKNIFLDRRSFLASYDATKDKNNSILISVVQAVIPVCAGINLEYYCSFVDRDVLGAGVKQPHNVTGMTGVVNGYGGDLLIGLAYQMVEIHEPMRITFIAYSEINDMLKAINKVPAAVNIIFNEWARMIIVDSKGKYHMYMNGSFVPFVNPQDRSRKITENSMQIVKGRREMIDFAVTGGEK